MKCEWIPRAALLCLLIQLLGGPVFADCPLRCIEITSAGNGAPASATLQDPETSQTVFVHSGSLIDHNWQVTEINSDSVTLRDVRSGERSRLARQTVSRQVSQPRRANPSPRLSGDPRNGKRVITPAPGTVQPPQNQTVQPSFTFGLPGDQEKKTESEYRFPAGR